MEGKKNTVIDRLSRQYGDIPDSDVPLVPDFDIDNAVASDLGAITYLSPRILSIAHKST